MDWYFPWSNFVWIVLMLLTVQHAIFVALKISVVISVSPLKQYPTRVNTIKGDNLINIKNPISYNRPRGPTDKASDYESGDSRFESWRGRSFIFFFLCCKESCYFNSSEKLVINGALWRHDPVPTCIIITSFPFLPDILIDQLCREGDIWTKPLMDMASPTCVQSPHW